MENYAIRRLQEKFIMQIAAQVLFEEGVKYMEQEMEEIDQRERIENPPREIRSSQHSPSVPTVEEMSMVLVHMQIGSKCVLLRGKLV